MHTFLTEENGWRSEVLGEDGKEGCVFFEYMKQSQNYEARIKLLEHVRNESFSVEAMVFERNGHTARTLDTAVFWEENEILGNGLSCKAKAAEYVQELRTKIDLKYFSKPC